MFQETSFSSLQALIKAVGDVGERIHSIDPATVDPARLSLFTKQCLVDVSNHVSAVATMMVDIAANQVRAPAIRICMLWTGAGSCPCRPCCGGKGGWCGWWTAPLTPFV